jgi:hypothetical protein
MSEQPNPPVGEKLLTGNKILDAVLGGFLALCLTGVVGAVLGYGAEALVFRSMEPGRPIKPGTDTAQFVWYIFVTPILSFLTSIATGFAVKRKYQHFGMGWVVCALALGVPVLGGLGICAVILGVVSVQK